LAFAARQRFVASLLIGATTMEQLRTNVGSATVQLGEEVIREINAVHRAHPNPCP
ncbi:MAG: aldo/keto reductase, partial [Steroidobacteraceae bacterium]